MLLLSNMFGANTVGFASGQNVYDLLRNLIFLAIMVIAATPYPKTLFYKLYEKKPLFRTLTAVGVMVLLVICTAYLVSSDFHPFLYFQF